MKDPAFLFYPAAFLCGVSDLTMEERGQYITLLCIQHQKGSINTKRVGLILGYEWVSLSSELRAKFVVDENGGARNTRLAAETEKRAQLAERQRINGSKGGRPKNPNKTQTKPNYKPNYKPKQNPNKSPRVENENVNENINKIENIEKGGAGEKEKLVAPMVVDLSTCIVSGNEWRTDIEAYRASLRQCYHELKKDAAWLAERKRLNPRVDVLLTLDKVCIDYWSTEEGWAQKKKSKSAINWKTTLAKSIGQKFNHVYENGKGNNQSNRGNAISDEYLADLARRAGISN